MRNRGRFYEIMSDIFHKKFCILKDRNDLYVEPNDSYKALSQLRSSLLTQCVVLSLVSHGS